jgi:cell division protein FtsL
MGFPEYQPFNLDAQSRIFMKELRKLMKTASQYNERYHNLGYEITSVKIHTKLKNLRRRILSIFILTTFITSAIVIVFLFDSFLSRLLMISFLKS